MFHSWDSFHRERKRQTLYSGMTFSKLTQIQEIQPIINLSRLGDIWIRIRITTPHNNHIRHQRTRMAHSWTRCVARRLKNAGGVVHRGELIHIVPCCFAHEPTEEV